jgi:Flp pilus assembly pilin Flp
MRGIAGILAFLAVVMIAVVILINEWVKRRRNNFE